MASLLNHVLKGQSSSYKIIEVLKEPSVFKAQRVPPTLSTRPTSYSPSLVVIKNLVFERELDTHRIPAIASCPFIRQLVDVIEPEDQESPPPPPKRMVFEWMDTDLWKARPYGKLSHPQLPQIVARSVLEALAVLHELRGVHTDINPNNVLLSDLDQSTPMVKVADLDQALVEGITDPNAQTLETRAPEVWQGLGCWPASDVWSVGVTLVHWLMSRVLFGPRGKVIEGHVDAWCMAKIMRLVGRFDEPTSPDKAKEWLLACGLEATEYRDPQSKEMKPFITAKSLVQELEALPRELCTTECIDFILYLLVLDFKKRPTASEALMHPYIRHCDVVNRKVLEE